MLFTNTSNVRGAETHSCSNEKNDKLQQNRITKTAHAVGTYTRGDRSSTWHSRLDQLDLYHINLTEFCAHSNFDGRKRRPNLTRQQRRPSLRRNAIACREVGHMRPTLRRDPSHIQRYTQLACLLGEFTSHILHETASSLRQLHQQWPEGTGEGVGGSLSPHHNISVE